MFFFVYFNEDYIFYNKNLFIQPKIGFKAFFTTKDAKSFVKINFLVTLFTFLSITRQNFEDNLRILANIGIFSRKKLKNLRILPICFKKTTFFLYFLIKFIIFTLKIFLFAPKIAFK